MRIILRIVLVVATAMIGLVAAARLIGALSAAESAALAAEGCQQPCWDGLEIGSGDAQTAFQALRSDPEILDLTRNDPDPIEHCALTWHMADPPYFLGCAIAPPADVLTAIELRLPDSIALTDSLRLATLFMRYGRPLAAQLCYRLDMGPRYRQAIFATVYFANDVTAIAYAFPPHDWQIDPAMIVKWIRYDRPAAESPIPFDAARWQGFGDARLYGTTCTV